MTGTPVPMQPVRGRAAAARRDGRKLRGLSGAGTARRGC